ncbi:MAG: class I SAM-dependent methyltransferase [Candidatus Binatia bacterium]
MDKGLFDRYYSTHFSRYSSSQTDRGTLELVRRKYKWNYDRFFGSLSKDARILDIGCGLGQFLYYLGEEGFQKLFGIDISGDQISRAKEATKKAHFEVADVFSYLDGKEVAFDVIVMNDFIEHVSKNEVLSLLRMVYQSLKSRGKIIIKTPNLGSPLTVPGCYADFTHEHGFSEHSLAQVLSVVGFQSICCLQEEIGLYQPLFFLKKLLVWPLRAGFRLFLYLLEVNPVPKIISANIICTAEKP